MRACGWEGGTLRIPSRLRCCAISSPSISFFLPHFNQLLSLLYCSLHFLGSLISHLMFSLRAGLSSCSYLASRHWDESQHFIPLCSRCLLSSVYISIHFSCYEDSFKSKHSEMSTTTVSLEKIGYLSRLKTKCFLGRTIELWFVSCHQNYAWHVFFSLSHVCSTVLSENNCLTI